MSPTKVPNTMVDLKRRNALQSAIMSRRKGKRCGNRNQHVDQSLSKYRIACVRTSAVEDQTRTLTINK